MSVRLTRARRGAILALLAALLLANPLYVGLLVDEPRERSPTGYRAVAVDPANPSDQQTIVRSLGAEEILDVGELTEEGNYNPYGAEYRARDGARAVIQRAQSNGTAVTTREDVAFTLHRIAANRRYVAFGDDPVQYYRLSVDDAGDETVVSLREVNRSTVAWSVVYADTRLYSSLPEYQRDTFERVVDAGEYGYRPYNDEFHELTNTLVYRDGTHYLVQRGIHVDDFGPSTRGVVRALLTLFGMVTFLAAGVLTALAYREADSDDGDDDDGGDDDGGDDDEGDDDEDDDSES